MLQLILFSLIYIFIFSGYYVLINFLNIMYPNEGFWSFVIFYFVYALGSLFSPYILSKVNFKLVFILSGISFLIMIGFAGSYISILLFIGSGICGLGNSFIWLIQGIHLTDNNMGLFYSLFNINMIFGNLISLFILLSGAPLQIMIFSMLAISGTGVILIFFIKHDKSPDKQNSNNNINLVQNIKNVFTIYKKCYLLILSMIYSSIGLNITYQIIPRLLISTTEGTINTKSIYNAIIYVVYGISAMLFSILWSQLFLKSSIFVCISYTIIEILCLLGIFLTSKYNTIIGIWIIFGFTRGCIDYGVNNLINITLSKYPKEDIEYLFSFYRIVYSLSYLITAIGVGYVSYEYILLICGIFSILSCISYYFFNIPEFTIEQQFEKNVIDVKNITELDQK